jgi:hypothetical protein
MGRRVLGPGRVLAAALAAAFAGVSAPVAAVGNEPAPAPAGFSEPPRPLRVHLHYARRKGAEQCMEQEALATAVEARLGRRVFVPRERADLLAEVRARRIIRRRFSIEIRLRAANGELLGTRRLESYAQHCSALDDSLALVLSLALDVYARAAALDVTGPEPSAIEPSTIQPRPEPPGELTGESVILIPANTHAARAPWHFEPAFGIAGALGLLPRPAVAAVLRLDIVPPDFWRFGLAASLWYPQRRGGSVQGVEFTARTLELSICPLRSQWGELGVNLCVQELFGVVEADGYGFDRPRMTTGLLLDLGLGGAAEYTFGNGFLRVFGSLLAPVMGRRYFYTEGENITVYETSWVSAVAGVSLGVSL